jgi:hypothetical protein
LDRRIDHRSARGQSRSGWRFYDGSHRAHIKTVTAAGARRNEGHLLQRSRWPEKPLWHNPALGALCGLFNQAAQGGAKEIAPIPFTAYEEVVSAITCHECSTE